MILGGLKTLLRFLNVFGLAVSSTLQCFLACEEMDLLGGFVPKEMSKQGHPGCQGGRKREGVLS